MHSSAEPTIRLWKKTDLGIVSWNIYPNKLVSWNDPADPSMRGTREKLNALHSPFEFYSMRGPTRRPCWSS